MRSSTSDDSRSRRYLWTPPQIHAPTLGRSRRQRAFAESQKQFLLSVLQPSASHLPAQQCAAAPCDPCLGYCRPAFQETDATGSRIHGCHSGEGPTFPRQACRCACQTTLGGQAHFHLLSFLARLSRIRCGFCVLSIPSTHMDQRHEPLTRI